MAEETAGIGNAAALITRAKPQDFGIVKGLKMAEASALAKAKMEAAAAAKKQAKLDKMMQFTSKVDRLKEPYTQKLANDLAMETYLAKEAAAESGDIQASREADFKYNTSIPFILQEDEKLSLLNPKNNKDAIETGDIYKKYQEGGLPKALEVIPSWLKGTQYSPIQEIGDGDWTVNLPKRIDLDNTYNSVINRIKGSDLSLGVTRTPDGKVVRNTRRLKAGEVINAAAQVTDDPNYKPYIVNDKNFQKYYKDNYEKGSPENLSNQETLDKAIFQYTREKLVKYNNDKTNQNLIGKGGIFMFNNGLGASTSHYDFFKQVLPTEGFMGLIENENINFGDAEYGGGTTDKTKMFLNESTKAGNITKVELPQDVSFSLTLEDKNRSNPSLRSVKPLDLVQSPSGQIYLVYGDGNDQNYTRHITPATTKILNSLKSFYYKDDAADVVDAISSLGIDLNKGFEKNPTVVGKKGKPAGSKPTKNKTYDPKDPL